MELVINNIIQLNKYLIDFSINSKGWIPDESYKILNKSNLQRINELSRMLHLWDKDLISEGELILAWVNLGALLEGSMKLFLCIYLNDYIKSDNKIMQKTKTKNKIVFPNTTNLDKLIIFYKKENLFDTIFKELEYDVEQFITKVQHNRNCIHTFKEKKLDSLDDYNLCIKQYLIFIEKLDLGIVYPDDYNTFSDYKYYYVFLEFISSIPNVTEAELKTALSKYMELDIFEFRNYLDSLR